MKTMTNVMSIVLNLGFASQRSDKMSTWNPAKEIKRPQFGNLDVGVERTSRSCGFDKGSSASSIRRERRTREIK